MNITCHESNELTEFTAATIPDANASFHSDAKRKGETMDSAPLIAIVDDDMWVRKSFERLMKSAGFKTESFASAEEFLESQNHDPGCVILDLKLPGMDGLELQRCLADEHRQVPIVFVSAHDDQMSKNQALRAGATAFLNKPLDEDVLLDAVDSALRPGKEGKQ
jgi:FixJ family two-component response regulator